MRKLGPGEFAKPVPTVTSFVRPQSDHNNPLIAFLSGLDEHNAETVYTWLDGNADAVSKMLDQIAKRHAAAFVRSGFFSRSIAKALAEERGAVSHAGDRNPDVMSVIETGKAPSDSKCMDVLEMFEDLIDSGRTAYWATQTTAQRLSWPIRETRAALKRGRALRIDVGMSYYAANGEKIPAPTKPD